MTHFENPILEFSLVMDRKLRQNAHKGGWQNCDIKYLFKRLRQELAEAERSVQDNEDTLDVQEECADIANFAMMIADVYEQAEGRQGT